jgi:hypothetical protein
MTSTTINDGNGGDRDARGRFLTGNSGGGRRKGSRNKLGEAFLDDLRFDWERHGPAVIVAVRKKDPSTYLKVVAGLLPQQLQVDIGDPIARAQSVEELVELMIAEHRGDVQAAVNLLDNFREAILARAAVQALPAPDC